MAQLRGWYEKMCTVHTVVEDVGIVIRVVVMMKGIAASILNVNGGGVREWAAFGMATATCQASKSCVNPATYSNNFYMHVMSWVGTLCICGSWGQESQRESPSTVRSRVASAVQWSCPWHVR